MKKSERMNVKKLVSDLKGIVGESYVSDDIYETGELCQGSNALGY